MARLRRIAYWIVGVVLALVAIGYAAFQVSPWPSVLLIRRGFSEGGTTASQAIEKHVPADVSERLDLRYDAKSDDAYLDVFYPYRVENSDTLLPTIVWVHGGGFVSGSKKDIANYGRVLAGRRFTVVNVDYSVAPEAIYPTPVRQVNVALAYLVRHSKRLHVDPAQLYLAGDSGGAHIVAQLASVVSDSAYAAAMGIVPSIERSQLAGVILYCGPYDLGLANFDGPFGGFLQTVLWAYIGRKDFLNDPKAATFSVIDFVTPAFPPTFISAGNADPLLKHSQALAKALASQGVAVDALFFPDDYIPAQPHEYQFNLDSEAGRMALERTVAFLSR